MRYAVTIVTVVEQLVEIDADSASEAKLKANDIQQHGEFLPYDEVRTWWVSKKPVGILDDEDED